MAVIDTVGTTVRDYPELTYWFAYENPADGFSDNKNLYLADVNNQHSDYFRTAGVAREAFPTRQYWGDFKRDAERDAFGTRQAIDCTIHNQELRVTKISKIDERDYVLNFENEVGSQYQYVVRDCNHYNHAFNRFAKRVREEINPRLGTAMTVVDARPEEEPVWPNTVSLLSQEQMQQVAVWARENAELYFPPCQCEVCRRTYKRFLAARQEQPAVTVETVISLVEQITNEVRDIPTKSFPIYELYMNTVRGDELLCGHDNPFWLVRKAQSLQKILSDMTPNVVYTVRDERGDIQATIDADGTRI